MSDRTDLQSLLERVNAGGDTARQAWNELICQTHNRLLRLARRIFYGDFPNLRNNHQTNSILHQAVIRLDRALESVHPATMSDFFRLSAQHMRWVLLDLARERRREAGRERVDPGYGDDSQERAGAGHEPSDDTYEPGRLAEWGEIHERIEALPEKERAVVELLWYQGLTQAEAAAVLGVSERTIKYRWRDARVKLGAALQEEVPED